MESRLWEILLIVSVYSVTTNFPPTSEILGILFFWFDSNLLIFGDSLAICSGLVGQVELVISLVGLLMLVHPTLAGIFGFLLMGPIFDFRPPSFGCYFIDEMDKWIGASWFEGIIRLLIFGRLATGLVDRAAISGFITRSLRCMDLKLVDLETLAIASFL